MEYPLIKILQWLYLMDNGKIQNNLSVVLIIPQQLYMENFWKELNNLMKLDQKYIPKRNIFKRKILSN